MTISKSLTLSIFIGLNLLANTNSTAQKTNYKTLKKEQVKSSLTAYEKYIDANNDDRLKEFMELVSIPTISFAPVGVPRSAAVVGVFTNNSSRALKKLVI